LAKLNDKYEKHKYYIKPRQAKGLFGVKHYAGEVSYEIKGFLDKNKDEASELMFMALATSSLPLVKALVEVKTEDDPSGKKTMSKKATVAGNFRVSNPFSPKQTKCVSPTLSPSFPPYPSSNNF
jgi:myosin-7